MMIKAKIRGRNYCYADLNSEMEEVILLVHGHPFNHSMWKYQYEDLKEYRLILPDLFGYGNSDFDFERIFIEHQALDLALLLDQLNIESVHLIGLSMGGQIIVEFCRLFPMRVKSLVICASLPSAESENSYLKRIQTSQDISETGMSLHTEQTIHKYINIKNSSPGSEIYEHLYEMMSTTTSIGAIAAHKGRAERRDNTEYLKISAKPTLVIAAENDFFFPVDSLKRMAESIPNSQFEVIKNSGHLPNMEQAETFNLILVGFYKRIE